MPVLPLVGSTIVPPGFSLPEASASSIIARAIRSLIDPPGLERSDFSQTWALSPKIRLTRICGVLPMVWRTLAAMVMISAPQKYWRVALRTSVPPKST